MPVKRYDPATKAAIIEATVNSRNEGRPWVEAFEAAKAAGYNGTREALEQMIRAARAKGTAHAETAFKRSGRPSKELAKAGLAPIENIIDKIVAERLNAALDAAIAALQAARKS